MNVPPPFPPSPSPLATRIPNYMIWAILITIASVLFCAANTIPGVIAIVFAAQVNTKLAAGDEPGAWIASRRAKLWCWITTGLTILGLCWTIWFISAGGMARYQEMMQELENVQRVQQ